MQLSILFIVAATLPVGLVASPAPAVVTDPASGPPPPPAAVPPPPPAADSPADACSPGYSYCGYILAPWDYGSSEGPAQPSFLYLCNADMTARLLSKCPTQTCQGPVAHCE